jgi:hypothetical protein
MAYLANHGFPQVEPGPSPDWEDLSEYNRVSLAIGAMGNEMSTDANGGTSRIDGLHGMGRWLQPQSNLFSVVLNVRLGNYCPRLADLAKVGARGGLVIVHVGYYNAGRLGSDEWTRDGGHMMSLVGAKAWANADVMGNPIVYEMHVHNPSSGDSTTDQSDFDAFSTTLTPFTAKFRDKAEEPFFIRTQDRLDAWGTGAFLDGYSAIIPRFVIASVLPIDPPGMRTINPVPVPPSNIPVYQTFPSPTGTAIVDAALLPDGTEAMFITEGGAASPNRLWRLDLVSGESTEIPLPEEPGQVVTGRRPVTVAGVNRSGDRSFYIDEGGILSVVPLPSGRLGAALSYVDGTDEVVILSPSSGELLRYPAGLATGPTIDALPAVIAPRGGVDLAVSEDGQEVWIADAEGRAIYRLMYGAGGGLVVSETIPCCTFTEGGIAARPEEKPEKISIGGSGPCCARLLVLSNGSLLELEPNAAGGWQPADDPLFSGHAASGFIDLVRSRTNYDPATMSGPQWRDVLPIAEFDCPTSSAPQPDTLPNSSGSSVAAVNNRTLSFRAGDAGRTQMIRVTFQNLPSFYSAWNGRQLYLANPAEICELGGVGPGQSCPAGTATANWAALECTPTCRSDWSELGVIHAFHEGIVPGGTYVIDVLDCRCELEVPPNPALALAVTTARWGDLVGLFMNGGWTAADGGVNLTSDVVADLDKFGSRPGAPSKPRADLEPACLDRKVNITDVTRALDAFRGILYSFRPQTPDPCASPCP